MTVSNYDIIKWIIVFSFLCFHCIVTYFIYVMRYQRKNVTYKSQFYLLYLMISFADIATIIDQFFLTKFILIEAWKPWFFENPRYNMIFWTINGYLIYFQSIMHASIAINRTWISYSLTISSKFLIFEKIGKRIIWFLPILALAIVFPRFWGTTKYFYNASGELSALYIEPEIKTYHTVAGPTVVISTGIIDLTFSLLTIYQYHKLSKNFQSLSSSAKQEIVLFFQACINFLIHICLVAYYVASFIATANGYLNLTNIAFTYFHYINDISSLCNPIILLLVCKFIREDFIAFIYGFKITKSIIVAPWNSTSNNGNANTNV